MPDQLAWAESPQVDVLRTAVDILLAEGPPGWHSQHDVKIVTCRCRGGRSLAAWPPAIASDRELFAKSDTLGARRSSRPSAPANWVLAPMFRLPWAAVSICIFCQQD